ncbi:hypothetical protein E1091_00245 [Micromonospora fluostatini]|uniref:DUF2188 domain-containing protein n=1 Tax=Micromonospora fluostatini TaxID=1629071 RepID=A0ABY2DM96_9ACTN|nr:hypothetical protein E1091_00245 [Micromonospora fluostatini]
MSEARTAVWVFESERTERGYVPSVVVEGKPGHIPLSGQGEGAQPWYWGATLEEARKIATEHNARRGLTESDVQEIVASSFAAQLDADRRRFDRPYQL